MAFQPESLYASPNALAPHYQRFRVAERCLLTGHSHQAWPDGSREGQALAWQDAAEYVDEKWEAAYAQAALVRAGWYRLLDDDPAVGAITLGQNTHDFLVRFLSALPLRDRPRVVTTDGEFHSMRRQLARFEEEGLIVHRVPSACAADIADQVIAAIDEHTATVMVSSVLFASGHIVPGLDRINAACRSHGIPLLVDTYHTLNAMPFSLAAHDLEDAYLVGGGYKYCQLGEGNGFLRFPRTSTLRPAVTGWFAEFGDITGLVEDRVGYAEGDDRFAGATYDPVSHYRAASVFDFFEQHELEPALLREVSQHQVGLLAKHFDALDADPALIDRDRSVPLSEVGGFLALRTPFAGRCQQLLRQRNVWTDYREDVLRLGPAPYLADRQLMDGIEALAEVVAALPATV
jgi:selenocysteine lyase/cysteine desulfurase